MATDNLARGMAASKLSRTGGTIDGNLSITGDLNVNGTTVTTRQETLMIKDNIIVTNADGKVLQWTSGLAIRSGSSLVYGLVYDPTKDTVMFGIGSLDSSNNFTFSANEGLPIAVRADSSLFVDGHFVKWDATHYCFVDGGSVSDIPNQKPFNPSWTTSSFTALIAAVYADTNVVQGDVYIGTVSGGKTGGMPFDGNAEVRIEVNTANRGVMHCEVTSSNVSPYHWECQVVSGNIYPWRSWLVSAPDGTNDLINGQGKINSVYIVSDAQPTVNSTNPVQSGGVYTALSDKQPTITGGATTIVADNLTASRALVSDANGKVGVSTVTETELGYVSGVTSAIQTQLANKLSTTGGTISGNLRVQGNLSVSTDKVLTEQQLGIRSGDYLPTNSQVWINTRMPMSVVDDILSKLELTNEMDVEGTSVAVAAVLFEDETNGTQGVYMADLSVLGGTGYIIFLARVVDEETIDFEEILYISDVTDSTNEAIIQTLIPTFTMPTDPGWLVYQFGISNRSVGPIVLLRYQNPTIIGDYGEYISNMFTRDDRLRNMIQIMIDYSVNNALNTPV